MRDDVRNTGARETISIQRAAVILDVHEDTILRLIKRGKLVAFKVGHQWRIHRTDLITYRHANQN
jgi:excisionase family DNA binding protein